MAEQQKKPFTRLSREEAYRCPYYSIQHDKFVLPNGKQEGNYYVLSIPDSAMVLPLLPDGRFVMVKQFRYIFQRWAIEFPCGGGKMGEEPLEIAKRELQEETGITNAKFLPLGAFESYSGVSEEICHVYLTTNYDKGEMMPDEDEEIDLVYYNRQEIDEMIQNGTISDGMSIAAWQLFKLQNQH